jgi:hypothetical protein
MTRSAAAATGLPAAPGVARPGAVRPAMPLEELDRWLRQRRQPRPVADSLAMFDGYITAIVVGPVTYEPLGWLCPRSASASKRIATATPRNSPRSRQRPNATTSSPPR